MKVFYVEKWLTALSITVFFNFGCIVKTSADIKVLPAASTFIFQGGMQSPDTEDNLSVQGDMAFPRLQGSDIFLFCPQSGPAAQGSNDRRNLYDRWGSLEWTDTEKVLYWFWVVFHRNHYHSALRFEQFVALIRQQLQQFQQRLSLYFESLIDVFLFGSVLPAGGGEDSQNYSKSHRIIPWHIIRQIHRLQWEATQVSGVLSLLKKTVPSQLQQAREQLGERKLKDAIAKALFSINIRNELGSQSHRSPDVVFLEEPGDPVTTPSGGHKKKWQPAPISQQPYNTQISFSRLKETEQQLTPPLSNTGAYQKNRQDPSPLNNLITIADVAKDNDCFFHAVSMQLPSMGYDAGGASQLRTHLSKLIDQLKTNKISMNLFFEPGVYDNLNLDKYLRQVFYPVNPLVKHDPGRKVWANETHLFIASILLQFYPLVMSLKRQPGAAALDWTRLDIPIWQGGSIKSYSDNATKWLINNIDKSHRTLTIDGIIAWVKMQMNEQQQNSEVYESLQKQLTRLESLNTHPTLKTTLDNRPVVILIFDPVEKHWMGGSLPRETGKLADIYNNLPPALTLPPTAAWTQLYQSIRTQLQLEPGQGSEKSEREDFVQDEIASLPSAASQTTVETITEVDEAIAAKVKPHWLNLLSDTLSQVSCALSYNNGDRPGGSRGPVMHKAFNDLLSDKGSVCISDAQSQLSQMLSDINSQPNQTPLDFELSQAGQKQVVTPMPEILLSQISTLSQQIESQENAEAIDQHDDVSAGFKPPKAHFQPQLKGAARNQMRVKKAATPALGRGYQPSKTLEAQGRGRGRGTRPITSGSQPSFQNPSTAWPYPVVDLSNTDYQCTVTSHSLPENLPDYVVPFALFNKLDAWGIPRGDIYLIYLSLYRGLYLRPSRVPFASLDSPSIPSELYFFSFPLDIGQLFSWLHKTLHNPDSPEEFNANPLGWAIYPAFAGSTESHIERLEDMSRSLLQVASLGSMRGVYFYGLVKVLLFQISNKNSHIRQAYNLFISFLSHFHAIQVELAEGYSQHDTWANDREPDFWEELEAHDHGLKNMDYYSLSQITEASYYDHGVVESYLRLSLDSDISALQRKTDTPVVPPDPVWPQAVDETSDFPPEDEFSDIGQESWIFYSNNNQVKRVESLPDDDLSNKTRDELIQFVQGELDKAVPDHIQADFYLKHVERSYGGNFISRSQVLQLTNLRRILESILDIRPDFTTKGLFTGLDYFIKMGCYDRALRLIKEESAQLQKIKLPHKSCLFFFWAGWRSLNAIYSQTLKEDLEKLAAAIRQVPHVSIMGLAKVKPILDEFRVKKMGMVEGLYMAILLTKLLDTEKNNLKDSISYFGTVTLFLNRILRAEWIDPRELTAEELSDYLSYRVNQMEVMPSADEKAHISDYMNIFKEKSNQKNQALIRKLEKTFNHKIESDNLNHVLLNRAFQYSKKQQQREAIKLIQEVLKKEQDGISEHDEVVAYVSLLRNYSEIYAATFQRESYLQAEKAFEKLSGMKKEYTVKHTITIFMSLYHLTKFQNGKEFTLQVILNGERTDRETLIPALRQLAMYYIDENPDITLYYYLLIIGKNFLPLDTMLFDTMPFESCEECKEVLLRLSSLPHWTYKDGFLPETDSHKRRVQSVKTTRTKELFRILINCGDFYRAAVLGRYMIENQERLELKKSFNSEQSMLKYFNLVQTHITLAYFAIDDRDNYYNQLSKINNTRWGGIQAMSRKTTTANIIPSLACHYGPMFKRYTLTVMGFYRLQHQLNQPHKNWDEINPLFNALIESTNRMIRDKVLTEKSFIIAARLLFIYQKYAKELDLSPTFLNLINEDPWILLEKGGDYNIFLPFVSFKPEE